MGRAPCCDKTKVKRGPWSPEEDTTLKNYIERFSTGGNWITLPHKAGLKRCGKSCRLRWLNYLRPNIKHGGFTEEEDNIILALYNHIGSRWSVIASHLKERTDNDVKNYWNTKLKKKLLLAANPPSHNTNKGNTTSNINSNITTNHAISSTTLPPPSPFVPNFGNYYHGSSDFSDPVQISLPRLMEVPQNGTSEVSSFSRFENNYGLWCGDGAGEDDGFLMCFSYDNFVDGYDFQEKIS